jgi:hypothetical protein
LSGLWVVAMNTAGVSCAGCGGEVPGGRGERAVYVGGRWWHRGCLQAAEAGGGVGVLEDEEAVSELEEDEALGGDEDDLEWWR